MGSTIGYIEFEYFLKLVKRQKECNISYLLKAANGRVIRSIVEIAYNLIKGDIPLTKIQIKQLKKDKKIVKYIISKRNTIERKRDVMYQNPKLVKTMLRIVLMK